MDLDTPVKPITLKVPLFVRIVRPLFYQNASRQIKVAAENSDWLLLALNLTLIYMSDLTYSDTSDFTPIFFWRHFTVYRNDRTSIIHWRHGGDLRATQQQNRRPAAESRWGKLKPTNGLKLKCQCNLAFDVNYRLSVRFWLIYYVITCVIISVKGNFLLLAVLWSLWSFVIGNEDEYDKIFIE